MRKPKRAGIFGFVTIVIAAVAFAATAAAADRSVLMEYFNATW